jgi:hypothetical protein
VKQAAQFRLLLCQQHEEKGIAEKSYPASAE